MLWVIGLSALLEIARALGQSECRFENSIILAALDMEEVGTHGAIAFVHEFLVKKILQPFDFPNIKVGKFLNSCNHVVKS